jgi:hypothetical protein
MHTVVRLSNAPVSPDLHELYVVHCTCAWIGFLCIYIFNTSSVMFFRMGGMASGYGRKQRCSEEQVQEMYFSLGQ